MLALPELELLGRRALAALQAEALLRERGSSGLLITVTVGGGSWRRAAARKAGGSSRAGLTCTTSAKVASPRQHASRPSLVSGSACVLFESKSQPPAAATQWPMKPVLSRSCRATTPSHDRSSSRSPATSRVAVSRGRASVLRVRVLHAGCNVFTHSTLSHSRRHSPAGRSDARSSAFIDAAARESPT